MTKDDLPVLGVIAVGGGLGAVARYTFEVWLPQEPDHVPWATLSINTLGCFLIGVLMVLVTEAWTVHRLVRPFLGVGILGGFTTFSTYTVEVSKLLETGRTAVALGYLSSTVIAAVVAVLIGVVCARTATGTPMRGAANA